MHPALPGWTVWGSIPQGWLGKIEHIIGRCMKTDHRSVNRKEVRLSFPNRPLGLSAPPPTAAPLGDTFLGRSQNLHLSSLLRSWLRTRYEPPAKIF